jgi:hypothetical protein
LGKGRLDWFFVVLRRTDGIANEYERIGLRRLKDESFDGEDSLAKEEMRTLRIL